MLVETPEDAERLGFLGSPTILIDGHDPFARGDDIARHDLSRLLDTEKNGLEGSPTIEQLADILS